MVITQHRGLRKTGRAAFLAIFWTALPHAAAFVHAPVTARMKPARVATRISLQWRNALRQAGLTPARFDRTQP
jgi:hypothetical protein